MLAYIYNVIDCYHASRGATITLIKHDRFMSIRDDRARNFSICLKLRQICLTEMFSGGSEWMVILVLALLLFGGSQIPKLAKSIGRAKKDFQDGFNDGEQGSDGLADAGADEART